MGLRFSPQPQKPIFLIIFLMTKDRLFNKRQGLWLPPKKMQVLFEDSSISSLVASQNSQNLAQDEKTRLWIRMIRIPLLHHDWKVPYLFFYQNNFRFQFFESSSRLVITLFGRSISFLTRSFEKKWRYISKFLFWSESGLLRLFFWARCKILVCKSNKNIINEWTKEDILLKKKFTSSKFYNFSFFI